MRAPDSRHVVVSLVLSHEFALPNDATSSVFNVLSGQIDKLLCSFSGIVHGTSTHVKWNSSSFSPADSLDDLAGPRSSAI
jgi:hypothetical protein